MLPNSRDSLTLPNTFAGDFQNSHQLNHFYAHTMNDQHNEGAQYRRVVNPHDTGSNPHQVGEKPQHQNNNTYKTEHDYHNEQQRFGITPEEYEYQQQHMMHSLHGNPQQRYPMPPQHVMMPKEHQNYAPMHMDTHQAQGMHPAHMPEQWLNTQQMYDRSKNYAEQKPPVNAMSQPQQPPPKRQMPTRVHPDPGFFKQPTSDARESWNVAKEERDTLKQLMFYDLSQRATGGSKGMIPALSKPSFCPDSKGKPYQLLVCGTEEQDPKKKDQNKLIFVQLESNFQVRSTSEGPALWSYKIENHVRDLHWINAQRIIFAQANRLGLVRLCVDQHHNIDELVNFPEFHSDTIREIAVCPNKNNLIISGGFDGKVFVTDIDRLVSDIQKNEKKSENSLYPCRDVVGSVRWHPSETSYSSCTTDVGVLHIFDIRTDMRRPAPVVFDTNKQQLYTHDYIDGKKILLGYGDGTISIFDSRMPHKIMATFKDPHMGQIGEIKMDPNTNNFAVFGIPEFSLWSTNRENLTVQCWGHSSMNMQATERSETYKTSGEFLKTKNGIIGVTDSAGKLAIFERQSKEQQENEKP